MRTKNSIKNMLVQITSQIIMTLLGFVSRKIFLDSLGTEYLGINGLLTNVLAMLALVESGIGTSITYHLYKPLADNDQPKVIALIQTLKKVYTVLAIIIIVLSIALFPFLGIFMKGEKLVSVIGVAYFIFVAKNITYYLNAHRISLINADQRGYVLARINIVFQITMVLARILILITTQNYLLFLGIELATSTIQQIVNGNIVNKRYSFIKTKIKYHIDQKEKNAVIKNVKALFLHNIGGYAVFGTDNILISSFVGVITVGLYSNYTMIIAQLGSLITPLLGGIGASVGNLVVTENRDKKYSIFKVSYMINFWIYSVCSIFLYNLLEPFINWWLGSGYLLDSFSFTLILVNFYINGLRSSIHTFKVKAGIFTQDKYVPLIEAAINLAASIILSQYLGLAGIFLGTTISTVVTVFWNVPRLAYKYVFQVPVWSYFIKYGLYVILTVGTGFITTMLCNFFNANDSFLSLVERGLICLAVPNIIYIVIFYKTTEFQYIKSVVKHVFSQVKVKLVAISHLKVEQ